MKSLLLGLALLSTASHVAAHGYVRWFGVNGTLYRGNIPNVSNFPSPIRAINNPEPVKGATNRSVNCGNDGQKAELVVPAMPGDELTFDWAGGDNGLWPHNIGPMLTYLASCGNTTCDQFDAINAQWFKIDEAGQQANGSWFQLDIMYGNTYSTHLPSTLAPGDYLVRHEIIALHLATTVGGAEFYPSCAQIRVGGNETGVPQPENLVSLPGAYSDTDPGIFDPDVFNAGANYTFPGPQIDPALSSSGIAITSPAPSTTGLPDPSFTATPSASKLKKVKRARPVMVEKRVLQGLRGENDAYEGAGFGVNKRDVHARAPAPAPTPAERPRRLSRIMLKHLEHV